MAMSQWITESSIEKLAEVVLLIVVVSTTGNGDPPDNASKFWRKLKRSKNASDWLCALNFTVLGLGDSNYDQFCVMGVNIRKALLKGNAVEFYPSGFADEAVGLESTVEPWLMGVVGAVKASKTCRKSSVSPGCVFNSAAFRYTRIPDVRPVKGLPKWKNCGLLISETNGCVSPTGTARWKSEDDIESTLVGYTPETPFLCRVKNARMLTGPESEKQVVHMELEVPYFKENKGLSYYPGDAVGMYCSNPTSQVDELITRLGLDPLSVVELKPKLPHIYTPCSVRDIFLYCINYSGMVSKALLRTMAEYCSVEEDREGLYAICGKSIEARALYEKELVKRTSFIDILARFPSCLPDLAHMLELLPPLAPRYYSVASSPEMNPSSMHFAFTVVNYDVNGETRKGLCSNWLYSVCSQAGFVPPVDNVKPAGVFPTEAGLRIPVFFRKTREFTLPSDNSVPIIMIGPGTGVAPFRGFIQHRWKQTRALQTGGTCVGWWRGYDCALEEEEVDEFEPRRVDATSPKIPTWGSAWLFFGCRRRDWDYLYGEEFEEYWKDDVLSEFHVAFSREQEDKVYVQDLIREQGERLCEEIVDGNASIFFCGDAAVMARDVYAAFVSILQTHRELTREESESYLKKMVKEFRYVQDIWA